MCMLWLLRAWRWVNPQMMIRLSHEFGFKIAAFHHALEAYKLLPEMAAEGIAAATWPDDWVGKAEGTHRSHCAQRPATMPDHLI